MQRLLFQIKYDLEDHKAMLSSAKKIMENLKSTEVKSVFFLLIFLQFFDYWIFILRLKIFKIVKGILYQIMFNGNWNKKGLI